MNSKEALETLGNVEVAVTTIRSGRTHIKTLKEQYETEFEVLERELLIKKELKDFDVYQRQLKQLEKELKQTKLNFRNSQIHSKNCYKKLKEKYVELQYYYNDLQKDYDVLDEECLNLEKENKELKEINEQLEGCNKEVSEFAYQIAEENSDLKQAFKFLRKELRIYCYEKENIHKQKEYWLSYKDSEGLWVTYTIPKNKYELLKEVFESVGEE